MRSDKVLFFALATLTFSAPALAADKKVSDLPSASALTGAELAYTVQGGADAQTTDQAIANLWVHGAPFSYTVAFGGGATLSNGTIEVEGKFPFAGHVLGAVYDVGSGAGTTTLAVQIGTTSITGLSAVTITAPGTTTASGANAIAAGGKLRAVFSSTTGTISDGGFVTPYGTFD